MELKHRQILSAQVDLSKFNKANFEKATDEEKKQQDVMGAVSYTHLTLPTTPYV